MTNEINAHAAASVVTDATANATPAGATQPCCLDSFPCARHASGPESELTRRKIEAAQTRLEMLSMVQRRMRDRLIVANSHLDAACLDVERASAELAELRKGTT